jgi:tRNA (cmo5U34)-methyltransferase
MSEKIVGDNIEAKNALWSFGGKTPDNFSQHVRRSVPMYEKGHELVCSLSDFFVKKNSICYELGSSVGELTSKLAEHNIDKPNVKWHGIDLEEPMTAKAQELCSHSNVEFVTADINLFEYEKSDFIVAYYVVQFVPPHIRQELINKIFETLNWGGAFLMFEKVRGPDARFQDILTSLYTDYKLNNDYTPEEIVAKSRSLKGILEPFSSQGNLDILTRAGFQDITTIMKYICFEGFFCIK